MPKATWNRSGRTEPFVAGRIGDRFVMTLESDQLKEVDAAAAEAGLSRNAYVRKALYHFMNCKSADPNGWNGLSE